MRKEYEAVCLEKNLCKTIDELSNKLGYASRAEFVRYCIFRELERHSKLMGGQV